MTSFLSRPGSFTLSARIPASIPTSTIIDAVHDHSFLITLSPLVTEHHQIPTDRPNVTKYAVTEKIHYLPFGLFPAHITFTTEFEDVDDGVKSTVHVPAGFDGTYNYQVRRSDDGSRVLHEEAQFTCNMLLMSFVKNTMSKAHVDMQKKFFRLLDQRSHDNSNTD
ncbi:MAG: hypothetical protein M1817_005772 [Caeruleum heppii]|nr:MAG: hypothetical protein M1817_005772 [Caeruleum heppii]